MIERHGRDVLLLAEIAERHSREDGGAMQQRDREVAERQAWRAAQSGDEWEKLMAKAARYISEQDWRKAAKA